MYSHFFFPLLLHSLSFALLFADMELDVQERLQLLPTMVCVVSVWPSMLKLEVSAVYLKNNSPLHKLNLFYLEQDITG